MSGDICLASLEMFLLDWSRESLMESRWQLVLQKRENGCKDPPSFSTSAMKDKAYFLPCHHGTSSMLQRLSKERGRLCFHNVPHPAISQHSKGQKIKQIYGKKQSCQPLLSNVLQHIFLQPS